MKQDILNDPGVLLIKTNKEEIKELFKDQKINLDLDKIATEIKQTIKGKKQMNYEENVDKIIEQFNVAFEDLGLGVQNGWVWNSWEKINLNKVNKAIATIIVPKNGWITVITGKAPLDLNTEQIKAIKVLFNKVQDTFKASQIEEELKNLIEFNAKTT